MDDIAAALDFTGKKGETVVEALVESGYLERGADGYRIHDWNEYSGKYSTRKEADRARKRATNSSGNDAEFRRNSSGNDAEFHTLHNNTLQDNILLPPVPERAGARVHAREDEIGAVMSRYMDAINPLPSSGCVADLKAYAEELGAEVVIHAIDLAADDGKRQWSYINAILKRYRADGLKSVEAIRLQEAERQAQKDAVAARKKADAPPSAGNKVVASCEAKKPATKSELAAIFDSI